MSTRPDRETAYRVFAAEFDDATLSYAESDEERAPNYVVTPTGARANRLFVVGVLTEVEAVNDSQLRARVVDPTGAFVVYAGQYQPEALSFLEDANAPLFVAVTGKARTFQPEDSNRVFTSVRPETLSEVDATTRDRFTVDTAERTLERIERMRDALARDERDDDLRAALESDGVERGLAAGIPRAISHYGTATAYLDAVEGMALDAVRVVAGEREEVGALTVEPDEGGQSTTSTGGTVSDADETTGGEPAAPTASPGSTAEPDPGATTDETADTGDTEPSLEADPSVETRSGMENNEPPESADESDSETESQEATDSQDGVEDANVRAESVTSSEDAESSSAVDLDDPEEFELSADEREHIAEEYGTDFETAGEVDNPGEADIETPTPDDESDVPMESTAVDDAATGDAIGTDATTETDTPESGDDVGNEAGVDEATTESGELGGGDAETGTEDSDAAAEDGASESADDDADSAGSPAADVDPEGAVVAAMQELDDGDGAERHAVVERVGEEYGLTPAEADDGIQSALMSGECYEPDDDTLKPI